MGIPKYKKYPLDRKVKASEKPTLSPDQQKEKEMAKSYMTKIQQMLKKPEMAKKAAKILEQMLQDSKKSKD